MAKLDKLYINSVSTRLLQISKNNFIEYKNKIFPNNLHRHFTAYYSASSYHCPSPITGSNIPKRDLILNFCSGYQRMNAPYLESSEQMDCLFPASLNKIRFHIFQNISKILIHWLRTFKYKITCELCDSILDKEKRGRNMVGKCFVFHKEVIDVFNKLLFPW